MTLERDGLRRTLVPNSRAPGPILRAKWGPELGSQSSESLNRALKPKLERGDIT